MKLLDRVITAVAPRWALNRAVARVKLGYVKHNERFLQASYEAAEKTRFTQDWSSRRKSADQAIVDDLPTMNARSRLSSQNDWVGASITEGYRRHVVGKGIVCRADARDENGEPLKEFNTKADRLFLEQWGRRPRRCDIEQRKTLAEIQGLIIEEFIDAGQAIVIWSYEPNADYVGLKLQLIESEQLATDMYIAPGSGREIRHGIEIGDYGEPVAYWIHRTGHPLESYNAQPPERIPASRVLHFMRQKRVRQTHGVTRKAAVLKKMRHLAMFDEYTLLRARFEACIGGVIETDVDGSADPYSLTVPQGAGSSEEDERGATEFVFEPGMHPTLPPGQRMSFHAPTTPGTTYEPFTQNQKHEIAAGAGLDFGTVAKDYRQGSFISLRMGTLERDREIEPLQTLLIDLVLRPIRELFIEIAILEGRLEAPGFFDDPEARERYLRAKWYPPRKPPINPAQHYAAAKIAIDYRLKSRAAFIAEDEGEAYEEVFDQIDDEQEYAQSLGIGLPDAPAERGGFSTKTAPEEPKPRGAAAVGRAARAQLNGHANRVRGVIHEALAESVGDEMATQVMEEWDE